MFGFRRPSTRSSSSTNGETTGRATLASTLAWARKDAAEAKPKRTLALAQRGRNVTANDANILKNKANQEPAKEKNGNVALKDVQAAKKPKLVLKPSTSSIPTVSAAQQNFTARRFNPFGVTTEYMPEIISYMRHVEQKLQKPEGFLSGRQANERKRSILVNWLIHVQLRFSLTQETLELAISLLDRALQTMDIGNDKLQLLGVTSLYVACKYEEVMVPHIEDFVYVAAEAFSRNDIYAMELKMLHKVDFDLIAVHPIHFLRLYRKKLSITEGSLCALMKFIAEVPLVEYSLAHLRPSLIAGVAVYLGHLILGKQCAVGFDFARLPKEQFLAVARSFVGPVMLLAADHKKLDALHVKHEHAAPLSFTDIQKKRLQDFESQK